MFFIISKCLLSLLYLLQLKAHHSDQRNERKSKGTFQHPNPLHILSDIKVDLIDVLIGHKLQIHEELEDSHHCWHKGHKLEEVVLEQA